MAAVDRPKTKPRVPAVDGWFTLDGDDGPALIGSRCQRCGTYSFPKQLNFCPNPACTSQDFDEVELSRHGRLWSYTNNCYQPPAPYVPPSGGFQPFAIAAVELEAEQMVVLGQLTAGVDVSELHVGQDVVLVVETLFEDDEAEYLVWKWRPIEPDATSGSAPRDQETHDA
ncbi:MAG: OB-fold domain-containing protein [Acidimicrobiales bacterium]|nr:OB-fold domain-containing protein [Acidimicrobiales bacterium]